ncbi:hypothetical protein [Weissella cibaria]|nr:hypothetical protein [Weissella cibaria]
MAAWNSGQYYEGERIKLHKFLDTVDTSKLSDLGRIEYVRQLPYWKLPAI